LPLHNYPQPLNVSSSVTSVESKNRAAGPLAIGDRLISARYAGCASAWGRKIRCQQARASSRACRSLSLKCKGVAGMRDPSGDWARMHRSRRNRKYFFTFASILVTALLISILGADLQVFR
ncbi:MAG: hypothetical protein WAM77_30865, partial [Xanthobacteraceae bacterium]